MQQNTKGLLLFVFLISISVFGINLFNNNDSEESVELTQTTLFETTTTTSPISFITDIKARIPGADIPSSLVTNIKGFFAILGIIIGQK